MYVIHGSIAQSVAFPFCPSLFEADLGLVPFHHGSARHMSPPRRSPRQARLQELLRSERIAAGLKQEEVARRLRRPQSFVSNYEGGERRLNVIELIDICEAIGIDPRRIMGELIKTK